MDSLLNILVLGGLAVLSLFLIFYILKKFKTKTYPERTAAMLDSIEGIEALGLQRTGEKYAGHYKDYHVSIFASTDTRHRDRFQVVVAVAPEKDQLKNIGGFFSTYFVIDGQPGFAYAGFLLNPNATDDSEGSLKGRLDILISTLRKAGVKPYKI